MKSKVLKYISKKIAALYWGYLKKEIDDFVINSQKKYFKNIGDNVIFKAGGTIYHPENLSIGSHVRIGDNCFIMAIGGVEIGEGTIISRNVCIHSGNHDYKSKISVPYDDKYITKKIKIGKAVWIGQNVNILPGIKIGDGAIIGMGTTISKNVEAGDIVVGNGQRIIGKRDLNNLETLLNNELFFSKEFPNL
ncbi:transferase [Pseudalgibacter alginicilyticus]|uniref:Transferase n=1 Tax=Pseudalgibacter alginicilyticus TaxID=1736674 RepID=A0A0P0D880_9FLAO|nr:acyltransferase [Pseudalgibacter alginicilyticus]ALJ04026.1 transferase [Pseudalgibacter alginicilyticus]